MGWYHGSTHTDMRQPITLPFQCVHTVFLILILSQQEKKASYLSLLFLKSFYGVSTLTFVGQKSLHFTRYKKTRVSRCIF